MGLFRKTMSLSTAGAVNYHSKRDLQKKELKEQANLAKEQAKQVKAERTAFEVEHGISKEAQREAKRAELKAKRDELKAKLAAQKARRNGSATADLDPQPADGPSAELEKLADLHERGVLTDEEFAEAKRKVLGL